MESTMQLTLQEHLFITRHRARLSRETMARLLDVSAGTIANWEKGRVVPEYRCLIAWCFVLGIPLSELGVEKIVCSSSPDNDDQNVA